MNGLRKFRIYDRRFRMYGLSCIVRGLGVYDVVFERYISVWGGIWKQWSLAG